MINKLRAFWRNRHRRALARYERKLDHIQELIDNGHLRWPVYLRLNSVCRKIEKLDARLSGKTR
jgi:hypothetical protein